MERKGQNGPREEWDSDAALPSLLRAPTAMPLDRDGPLDSQPVSHWVKRSHSLGKGSF